VAPGSRSTLGPVRTKPSLALTRAAVATVQGGPGAGPATAAPGPGSRGVEGAGDGDVDAGAARTTE